MTRLKPPARKIPPAVADQAKLKKTSSVNSQNNNNNNHTRQGKLQMVLILVMAVCMGMTLYVNVTSTSASNMDMIQYSAAFHQAIEDFRQGAMSRKSTTTTSNQQQQSSKQQPVLGDSLIAKLSCEPHGGPADEFAQEMIYWEDIPSDALWVSPFRQKRGEHRRYMTFEPDGGGWNNIRMAMETVVGLAAAMGRTLVLPPQKQMYLLGKGDNKQKRHFGFEDFFPMQQMAMENAAIDMITMKEFLELEAMTGNLKDKATGRTSFPPYNRTDWNGLSGMEYDELREWLRTVTLVPQWNPEKCLAAFPANGDHSSVQELIDMQQTIHKEGIKIESYIGNPVPVDGPPIDRMKENLNNRRDLCVYDEAMEKEMVVHFACAHKLGLRLLVHFYEFLYLEDWKEDLWMKRFMRDHMRYNDDIQCAAARLVHMMRQLARKNGNPTGEFDSFHIRRGDFQYKNTRIPAEEILTNIRQYLTPNTTIFIATMKGTSPSLNQCESTTIYTSWMTLRICCRE
ncbi:GDP-fucose protein O-fucosyltransferase [Seminavis robusta]|uniref:GDP-fucose protein O-fucosyltransferase n=1 Tax=Seminavis robusta TaxID=568900 RepID=A0A9N8HS63_9STRA|nr:GDP-fucose protein O-fucosyltransferase [Seminavis robusta]|eukprot:Sro1351_g265200.1 GDP-fucose protein O-fucosyltransferase (511) ;mRNA; r:7304-8923